MRNRTRSDDDLKSMSEYGSDWGALLALQIGLFFMLWLLFSWNWGNSSLSSDLQNLRSLNQVKDLMGFLSAIMLVPYFFLLMTSLNVLLFQTLIKDTQRKLKLIFNWDLFFWGSTFLLLGRVVDFEEQSRLVATKQILPTTIFLLLSFYFFYRYVRRVSKKYQYIAVVVSVFVLIYFLFMYSFAYKESWSILTGILTVLLSLLWVFLAQALMIFAYLFIGMIISAATNEYRSAQLGKEIQYRRLIVKEFRNYFGKHNMQVNGELTGKSFSLHLLQDVLKEIINLKGRTFHERLTLIKEMVQIDVSADFPAVKAKYLKFRNTINVRTSIVFLLNIIVIVLFVLPYLDRKDEALLIMLILITIRLFQRMIEIGWAFYQDITSTNPKSSTLTGSDRLILAVKSIFEMMITSALFYFLFDSLGDIATVKPFKEGYVQYFQETFEKLLKTVVGSVSVSFFNVSLPLGYHDSFTFKTVIHLFQVGISIILITLSIANYLNMKKNAYQYSVIREEDDYAAYYYLQLSGEEPLKREIARGTSKEGLKEKVKAMWQEQQIDDAEFASVIACLDIEKNELESGKIEIEKLREMNFQQLSDYVRQMLRDNPHKSNKSIKLIKVQKQEGKKENGFFRFLKRTKQSFFKWYSRFSHLSKNSRKVRRLY